MDAWRIPQAQHPIVSRFESGHGSISLMPYFDVTWWSSASVRYLSHPHLGATRPADQSGGLTLADESFDMVSGTRTAPLARVGLSRRAQTWI